MALARSQSVTRFIVAAGTGSLLLLLPHALTQGVHGPDLSSRLGLAGGVGPGTFVLLFAAGLLTSLTPCVYPLIPITVGVFGARRTDRRARSVALSATYVAGIAVMYSALGVSAALSGKAFGAALANPWVVGALAAFFLAIAASMLGAFELSVPTSVQERLVTIKGAGFLPAFGMGLVAGIVAAPCTGPVLAGVLAFVATRRSAVLGFWMLFTYALGMGLLFFVIGATSIRLPRSGAWMETVKTLLGVALIAAGVGLLLPLLPRPPALPFGDRALAIAAGVLAFGAVLAGALGLSFHGRRGEQLQKALGLLVLLLAVGLRLGWLGAPQPGSQDRGSVAQIHWLHDEAAAVAQARASGKPLLVDFFAEWCAACKELDLHTFSDPQVRKEVTERFVPLKVDATNETNQIDRLIAKYNVPGLPTVLLMACNDEPAQAACAIPSDGPGRISGFVPAADMLERMNRIQR
jgi:thiol:disulfide interchange protein DsbD